MKKHALLVLLIILAAVTIWLRAEHSSHVSGGIYYEHPYDDGGVLIESPGDFLRETIKFHFGP